MDETCLPDRLRREVDSIRGVRRGLPLTAGLEEVAEARHWPVVESVGKGRSARVISIDRDFHDTIGIQLAEFGFEIADTTGRVDLTVIDGDPIQLHQPECFLDPRATSKSRFVLLTSGPEHAELQNGLEVTVASKFAPVGEWLKALVFAAVLVSTPLMSSCGQRAGSHTGTVEPTRKAWWEQIEAVRSGHSTSVSVTEPISSSDWKALTRGCESLEVLEIEQSSPAAADYGSLAALPQLRRFKLGAGLTDDGAAVVGTHPTLSELIVASDVLTDAGVASVCQLPLVQLRLRTPRVTDAAMTAFEKLDRLRFLHLLDVPLTDAGLPALAGIKSLESLYLDRTKCTDEGLSALLKQRPDIHFHRDQTHLRDDPQKHEH